MIRRTVRRILAIIMCVLVMESIAIKVYASNMQVNMETDEKSSFEKSKEKCKYTKKKINEEKNNRTDVLSDDLEEYLNGNGVFDNEILKIEDDVIKDLESVCDKNDIQIQTEFFEVVENNMDNQEQEYVGDAICKELNENEINEIIGEIYYEEKETTDKNKERSIIDKTLEVIGIKPVDIYADTENSNENSSSFMKKQLMIFPVKYNNKQFYRIYFMCHWLTAPENRLVDTVYLNWDSDAAYFEYDDSKNDSIMRKNTNASIYYVYNEEDWLIQSGECINSVCKNETISFLTKEDYYVLPSNTEKVELGYYSTSKGGMAVSFDLMDNAKLGITHYANSKDDTVQLRIVDEIFVTMNIYVKRSNEDKAGLLIEGDYWHQQKKTKCKIKYTQISFASSANIAISFAKFVYTNLDCVKVENYSKSVGGGLLPFTYLFK